MMVKPVNGATDSLQINVEEYKRTNDSLTNQDDNYENRRMESNKKNDDEEPNESLTDEKPGFKSLWADFASTTTAHGFSQLLISSNGYMKCFWLVAIIGCQVLLCIQIYPLIARYLQKPTKTKINMQNEPYQVFPMITICNTNAFKQSKINLIKEHELYEVVEASELNKKRKRRSHTNETEEDNSYDEWVANFNMFSSLGNIAQFEGEEVFQFGHQLDDMLYYCYWKFFTDCSDPKWWRQIWSWKYGNCYTFNVEERGTSLENVTGSGPDHGLLMMLKLNQKDYSNSSFEESAGMVLHIGEQGSQINPVTDGYHLAPNFDYIIGLKKTVVKRADPFKNESCIHHKHIDLGPRNVNYQHLSKYTVQTCRNICEAKAEIENCGCTHYYYPSLNANHTCDITKVKCSDDIFAQALNGDFPCFKECRLPCEETKFEMETSFSKFNPIPSPDYESDDALRVNIFFKTMETQLIEDAEFYFIENLLGDIGGQLGLFSGVSALTVIEVVLLMVNLVFFIKIYFQWTLGCKNNRIGDAKK